MDQGPLPPHERPWRHPSELGPPEHEASTSGAKVLIVTTATLSLLLVGLLVVAITPGSSGSDADGVTTVVAVRADQASAVRFDERASRSSRPSAITGLALTTRSAVGRSTGGDEVAVQLPNGQVVDAAVVSVDEARGLAVVSIPDGVTTETFAVADAEGETLAPDDTVMVHGAEPQVMSVAALRATDVDEGTPVSDGEGNLLGLCTVEQDATMLMAADASAMTAGTVATTAPTAPSDSTVERAPVETVSPVVETAATTSGTD